MSVFSTKLVSLSAGGLCVRSKVHSGIVIDKRLSVYRTVRRIRNGRLGNDKSDLIFDVGRDTTRSSDVVTDAH